MSSADRDRSGSSALQLAMSPIRPWAGLLVSMVAIVAIVSCGSTSSGPSQAASTGEYFAEISELEADPAVQWVPPGAVVDVVRFRDDCIGGFDPVIPQHVREFAFVGPRDAAAIAEGFRTVFADAGWSKAIDTQTTQNTGGPNGRALSFTKDFGDWSALAEVNVSHPDDDDRRGLSTSVVASIDPIPC